MRTLIADHDATRAKTLSEACIARGMVVECAPNGAAALELALERNPDVVICPIDLPVIDAVRLAEILRGNPRTRAASLIFLVNDELDAPISMDPRDVSVASPWHQEEVLSHIDAVLERMARFGEIRSDSEVEGKLSQISVLDLLQIFQMNAKTGTLRLSREGGDSLGSIWVRSGQVTDASMPLSDGSSLCGEKALYRLLSWRDGRFEFLPGEVTAKPRIHKPMRALLLEGVRHKDEWEQRRRELPSDSTRLRLLVQRDEIPTADQPITRDVIAAVESYRRVGDVVDHTSHPDYQVVCVLADLLARGQLGVEELEGAPEGSFAPGDSGIFTLTQIRRLREWISSLRPRPGPIVKIVVAAAGSAALEGFCAALRESADFAPDPRSEDQPGRLGALGHFPLGEGLHLRLVAVGADPTWRPLWDVALWGALGAVVLPEPGRDLDLEDPAFTHFTRTQQRPVVHLMQGSAAAVPEAARAQLAKLGGGFYFLPGGTADERLEVFRDMFARYIP